MDNSDDVVKAAPKRPNFSDEFRRAIVEMTMQPGASVSRIAREHGLNDNMVFKWRQRLRSELAAKANVPVTASSAAETTELLPVSVVDMPPPHAREPATTNASCDVEVEVGKRRVRIRGVPFEFAERLLQQCLK